MDNQPSILCLIIIVNLYPLFSLLNREATNNVQSWMILPKTRVYMNWQLQISSEKCGAIKYILMGEPLRKESLVSYANKRIELNLQSLLYQIPGFLYWKDTQSRYLGCNENFARVAGLRSIESIVGKTDFDLAWGKTEAQLFRQGDQEVISGHPFFNRAEPQLQADGRYAMVLATKIPLLDHQKTIVGVLGLYQDITDIKLGR
jgi:PAS domain S-box-containing protein